MNKKILIQSILIFTIIIVIASTYFIYFYDKKKIEEDNKIEINAENNSIKDDNRIESMRYFSEDNFVNTYLILSDYGQINQSNPNIIYMEKVTAEINMVDSATIYINSDFAEYHNQTYETDFEKNVIVKYLEHLLNSEKMNLSFENNKATVSENVIYNNLDTNLKADRIEVDLITKNSRIFMNDNNEKVMINSKW